MIQEGIKSYYYNLEKASRNSKLFLLSCFFIFLGRGGLRVIFNLYVQTLGYSEQFIGGLSSARFVVAGIIAIPSAIFASRIGFKKALIFSGILIVLTISGIGLSTTSMFLIIFNILWGSAQMILAVITAPFLVKNSTPEERPHLFGLNFALIMITGTISKLGIGNFVDYLKTIYDPVLSYKITILGLAVITSLGLISFFFIQEKESKEEKRVSDLIKKLKNFVVGDRNIKKLILYSVFIGIGAGMIVPLFNIFLRNKLAASDGQIGTIMALANIATAVGSLATPFIIKILGRIKTIFIPQMLSIIFLLMIALVGNIYLVGLAFCLRMAFMNMVNPVIRNFSMEIVPRGEQANTSSIMRSIRRVGRGIGSFFSGLFLGSEMYIIPFVITAILYTTASIIFVYSFRHEN